MNNFDDEICIKKYIDHITKRDLMNKVDDKILTTSIPAASKLIEKGFYDVWTLDIYSEYERARKEGITPQFARGLVIENNIFIPYNAETRIELSDGVSDKPSFPTIDQFRHIVIANQRIVDREIAMASATRIDPIIGFCLNEADLRIASFIYLYQQAINKCSSERKYELNTENYDGYQYTFIKKRKI